LAAGVTGAIVPVDSYASVQSAYAAWDANPCSVGGANDVVAAIAAVVDQIRADNPTLQNLVIVGADDQIPFARLADGAIQSNERDYGASTFAGENNVEADALSLGYYFSDDPYASPQPLGVGSATLYTPEMAVGRLVESAPEIESALTRFVSSQGDLDSTAGLTTGYSFLTSGADAVSADLAADGLTPEALINEDWSRSDLVDALAQSPTPGVDSVNAHFDYSRLLPADDNASGQDTDLFTTTDVRDALSSYAGRLLFSMGCHSGLDIDDAEVAASGVATPVDDWAKAFADAGALWVGNTGYGYADTDTIAYSAKLMADFAANLGGPLSIGEALSAAKQQYAAGNAVLSPYDLKALMESTLFGLPMYKLNQGGPGTPGTGAPPAPLPTTLVDQATGLTDLTSPVDVNLGLGTGPGQLGLVATGNGEYYQVNGTTAYDAGTQTTEYRPVEPLVSTTVTEPGLVPHGALVTALSSSDVADPTPLYSMPSAGSAGATPPEIGYAAFPGTLQRVSSYGSFSASGTGEDAQLDLVAGQFIPSTSSPGAGTERLFGSMSAQVYYLPPTSLYAQDFTPPTIDYTEASDPAAALNFDVQVTPSVAPVEEVLILYTDAVTPGTWQAVNLSSSNGQTWTGSAAPTASGQVQYIVEALDAAGNVAVSNNEGTAFNASGQAGIGIALSGKGPVNGFYTGTVTATVAAPAGSTYVLDGAAPTAVPAGGVITISTSGEHTLTVTDPSGQTVTQAFAISTYQTMTTPSLSTSAVVVGQSVTVTASVSPASEGVGNPTGFVEFFDGATPIATCGGAAGTALSSSGQAVCTFSYAAIGTHQITARYLGDPNFAASTSSATGLTVDPRTATVSTFHVSGNPSTFGAETGLVFSVTVTPGDDDPFPSGDTVTVSVGDTTLCTITLVPGTLIPGTPVPGTLVPGTLDPGAGNSGNSGSGSCSPLLATALPAGSYPDVTATFNQAGADPDFEVSAPATLQLVVDAATTVPPPPPTSSPVTTPVTSPTGVAISWASPAPITFGTRLTSAQLDATASVPGLFRYSPSMGAVLQPGTDTLRVTFTPTGVAYAVTTTSTTTISVGFTSKCITTAHRGPLVITRGDAVCVRPGAKIDGDVSVSSGGALFMGGGTISGSLRSSGALAITLCGTTVTGPVSVETTSGPVTMGGPGCAADALGTVAVNHTRARNPTSSRDRAAPTKAHHASTGRAASSPVTTGVTISGNAGGVYIRGSRVTGPTVVSANLGGITISGNTLTVSTSVTRNKGGCTFTGNKVSGPLVIKGNTGGFKFSGNTVHGPITRSANS
ncbi:MAG TPA: Ig-like domain repeat protein, partial [Acidimicrobiales bacterium]|nr:Ig-like domain repeat protein [Acidimicrobiales bacterium]